jgi:iron complex transport system substrate-binding protein
MPLSLPAAKSPRSPAGALILLALVAVMLLGLGRPARAAVFTDSAGRRVALPAVVTRVLPADRSAEVLLLVLAPEKLAGLGEVPWRSALPNAARVPVIEWQRLYNPARIGETARRLHADLIIDAGPATPERAAHADLVQRTTGIAYILVDDSFARMPQMMRAIGAILGVQARADDLGTYAEHAIAGLRGRLMIEPPDRRPRVYFALGAGGLLTALPGSPAAAVLEEAGTINVAAPLGRGTEAPVTAAQLRAWNPDLIIAESRAAYDHLRRDRAFRDIAAVRRGHVYLEPTRPFGWIEDPSGVNRVIGLHWLSVLLYPGSSEEDLRTTVCDFYDKFYRIKLTNGAIESLVRPAGIAPVALSRPVGETGLDLGTTPETAPTTTLPGLLPPPSGRRRQPGALPGAPGTLPGTTPGVSGMPGAAELGVTGVPSTAPNAPCTVPTGPNPRPLYGVLPPTVPGEPGGLPALPGATPELNAPAGTPGLPPPGRRGLVHRQPGASGLGTPAIPGLPEATPPAIETPK